MPTPLQKSVQSTLQEFVENENKEQEHDAIDVLRTFQKEASLMYETLALKDLIRQDPFVSLEDAKPQVDRLCSLLQVTDCHRVVTKLGYSFIDAVVKVPVATAPITQAAAAAATNAIIPTDNNLQLSFQYERRHLNEGDNGGGTTVTYSIDMSRNHGPNERLLWVQVFAMGSAPSHLPAKSLDGEDGGDEWEDMEQDEDGGNDKMMESKGVLTNDADADADADDTGGAAECDRYVAHMDPDVLGRFLEWSGMGPINEATAFFLLMTFPFYEHEWDLVGFILDSVFGFNDDDDDDDENEQDMDDDL